MEIKVKKISTLQGNIQVPGDKSISHRSGMLAALSNGPCQLTNYLPGEDCLGTLRILGQLGVHIESASKSEFIVHGCAGHFSPPSSNLDCGNSGTTMRLMSGLLAAQPFRSRMIGDLSLSKRPMKRIMDPLAQMGAKLTTEGDNNCPPLIIDGTSSLHPIDYLLPVPSAQVKSAILLAGLLTHGTTTVIQPIETRDHTERMLEYFGVPVTHQGDRISVTGGILPKARDFAIPGDISSAAFWLVAAACMPESHLVLNNVGLNPSRIGILAVLRRMGASIEILNSSTGQGEPSGDIIIKGGETQGTEIGGSEIPNVIDELPILAVAAALSHGTTIIRDASELRVKESDRLAVVVHHLQAMGADVTEFPDGMEIRGGCPLHAAVLESHHDHRIAMAFAIAGLFAEGETVIQNAACVETSYPGFVQQLKSLIHG